MRSAFAMLTIGLLSASSVAQAITLHFEPSSGDVEIGSSVDVGVVISDLGDFAAPSLGTFDLHVLFDPALVAVSAVTFGDPVLGDQLDLFASGSISGYEIVEPGALNVFEISLDLPEDLDDLQAGSFTLFTLTFDALAQGTSELHILSSTLILGDALGDPLLADLTDGSVTVPEPAAFLLVLLGSVLPIARRSRLS